LFVSDLGDVRFESGFIAGLKARLFAHQVLAIWIGISTILVLTGPFGTYELWSWPRRIGYWSGILALAIVLTVIVRGVIQRLSGDRSMLVIETATALVFSALFTPVVCRLTAFLAPPDLPVDLTFGAMFPVILPISLSVGAIHFAQSLAARRTGRIRPTDVRAAGDTPGRPALARRIPNLNGAAICWLRSDNHHLQVLLSDGRQIRLLIRLADAVNEMEGVPGVCTHRSHWVSLAAVTGFRIEKARPFLILASGDAVPVSRTYRPRVEAAGLLGPV
jgi:hypothetical protein